MPLKVVVRSDTGTLWITGTIKPAGSKEGIRIRQRAGSNERTLAEEEAAALEREILRNHHLGHKPIERDFAAAASSYLKAEDRSAGTIALVQRLIRYFGTTQLRAMDQDRIDGGRDVILRPGSSQSTWARTVALIAAIMNHAAHRGWCSAPNYQKPSEPKGRTEFMMPDRYLALENAASQHMQPLLRYLVCTGARLGETLSLDWSQVDLGAARVLVWADQTKAKRSRVVDLTPAAIRALANIPHREGRVFRNRRGEPYAEIESGGGQLRTAWGTAAAKAGLPGEWQVWERKDRPGKMRRFLSIIGPHHLRHTWATWHYAIHKDLLLLKAQGDWSDVSLCERYAHLMPSGYADEIKRVWGLEERVSLAVG